MNMIVDDVFGEMIYDHSWERTETLDFFGKELNIKIVAEAYSGQDILEIQKESYKRYISVVSEYTRKIPNTLLEYYLNNYDVISSDVDIPEQINKENITKDKIIKLVKVTVLYFSRDGKYGYLCDCAWDKENGICIVLSGDNPEIKNHDYLI